MPDFLQEKERIAIERLIAFEFPGGYHLAYSGGKDSDVDWTDDDVLEFLRHYSCESNPLYKCGFKRIGCIGCPMAGKKKRIAEFERYPEYKEAYIRAFDRMLERRKEKGVYCAESDKYAIWKNGKDVMDWWLNI